MMSVNLVLKQILELSKAPNKSLGLVSGNQSGDADSILSAISYCYLNFQYQDRESIYLPFLNFPKDELRLRKDVLYVFNKYEIDQKYLLFSDDLASDTIKNFNRLILVDHNIPQGRLQQYIDSVPNNQLKITGIIDHHEDEGYHLNVKPRIVLKAGSCSSLVYDYFKSINSKASSDTDILKILINPLILDTFNMKSRVEHLDKLMFEDYTSIIDEDTNIIYEKLIEAKNDIDGLTFTEVLNKDYKSFESGNVVFGIASIVKPFGYVLEHFTENEINININRFTKSKGIEFLVIMTAFSEGDKFRREIGFFNNSGLKIEEIKDELQLEELDNKFDSYKQLNLSYSRKQIAPLIKKKVENWTLTEQIT
ncbi:hypothetical protein WICMUC_001169 [Wickerhamomyces mucosus]|uniref:DHHA2 domain-containing protein n=1 Tax=Wickerhamomyces mucosus TaxID=1378264 RepID=A0A9P8TGX7_9ASCO|nr:hypothetical protein WICMUC_001169 [Wickerhamomyces mucosus]